MKLNTLTIALLLCIVSLFLVEYAFARGGRGGGGSRGGGFRSSYRSSRTSYRSSRTSYRSSRSSRSSKTSRYGKYAAAAAAGYYVHGMTRYRSSYYGTSHYREDPNVCRNVNINGSSTASLSTRLGYFVCPYVNDEPDEMYCCGPEGAQKCCSYWSSPKKGGAIAGIVIGSLVVLIIVAVCCCKCCKGRGSSKNTYESSAPASTAVAYNSKSDQAGLAGQNGVPDHHDPLPGSTGYSPYPPSNGSGPPAGATPYPLNPAEAAPYPPQPMAAPPYPAQPDNPSAIGFEGQAPPPEYNAQGNYPTKS